MLYSKAEMSPMSLTIVDLLIVLSFLIVVDMNPEVEVAEENSCKTFIQSDLYYGLREFRTSGENYYSLPISDPDIAIWIIRDSDLKLSLNSTTNLTGELEDSLLSENLILDEVLSNSSGSITLLKTFDLTTQQPLQIICKNNKDL